MELKQNCNDNFQEIGDRNKKTVSTENFHYLYPNGHRTTHQMKWFKGSQNRDLRSDKAA